MGLNDVGGWLADFWFGGGGGGTNGTGGGSSWGDGSGTPVDPAADAYRLIFGRDPDPNDPVYQQMIAASGGAPAGGPAEDTSTGGNAMLDFYKAMGLTEEQAQAAALQQAGLTMTPYQAAQLEESRLQRAQSASNAGLSSALGYAQIAAANARADADRAISEGNLDLARQKRSDENYWNNVAAQFSAGSQALGETNAGISAFNAQSNDRSSRTSGQLGAGNIYGELANLMGNLSVRQQELGLDILSNPRNAVAGFLMGIGGDPASANAFGDFNVQRILGINPQSIQDFVGMAMQAAQQAQQQSQQPNSIDLNALLAGMQGRIDGLMGNMPAGNPNTGATPASNDVVKTPVSTPAPKEATTHTRVPSTQVVTTPANTGQFWHKNQAPYQTIDRILQSPPPPKNQAPYQTIDRILAGM